METEMPNLNNQQQYSQQNNGPQVYSRRKCQIVEFSPSLETCHESDPNLDNSLFLPSLNITDDLPIALRKCVCACTQQPISQVVQYEHLSPSEKA